MRLRKHLLLFFILIFYSFQIQADQQSSTLVDWSSEQGIQRLASSQSKVDFFKLANNF